MDKIKLLTYAVVGLLLLNVGIIGFLFFSRPNRNPEENHRRPKDVIAEKLHFDAKQIEKYESIIPIHKDKIDSLDAINRELKSELYSQLKSPVVNMIEKDSIITLFLANQKRIEETHFKHFQDIKSICKVSQLQDFNALTQELGKMFSHKNFKQHPPVRRPPRNEDFPKPLGEKNQVRQANDTYYPSPPPRDRNHPRPPRDENRPPPPRWDEERPRRTREDNRPHSPQWNEDRPQHSRDENRPPPPPRPDDE
jgi:hypothetical protein